MAVLTYVDLCSAHMADDEADPADVHQLGWCRECHREVYLCGDIDPGRAEMHDSLWSRAEALAAEIERRKAVPDRSATLRRRLVDGED